MNSWGRVSDYQPDYLDTLRRAQRRAGISFRYIGRRIDRTGQNVGAVFQGRNCSPATIRRICETIGLDFERDILR